MYNLRARKLINYNEDNEDIFIREEIKSPKKEYDIKIKKEYEIEIKKESIEQNESTYFSNSFFSEIKSEFDEYDSDDSDVSYIYMDIDMDEKDELIDESGDYIMIDYTCNK